MLSINKYSFPRSILFLSQDDSQKGNQPKISQFTSHFYLCSSDKLFHYLWSTVLPNFVIDAVKARLTAVFCLRNTHLEGRTEILLQVLKLERNRCVYESWYFPGRKKKKLLSIVWFKSNSIWPKNILILSEPYSSLSEGNSPIKFLKWKGIFLPHPFLGLTVKKKYTLKQYHSIQFYTLKGAFLPIFSLLLVIHF